MFLVMPSSLPARVCSRLLRLEATDMPTLQGLGLFSSSKLQPTVCRRKLRPGAVEPHGRDMPPIATKLYDLNRDMFDSSASRVPHSIGARTALRPCRRRMQGQPILGAVPLRHPHSRNGLSSQETATMVMIRATTSIGPGDASSCPLHIQSLTEPGAAHQAFLCARAGTLARRPRQTGGVKPGAGAPDHASISFIRWVISSHRL